MNEYLLFVDTETTGLPQRWDQPYGAGHNWPYIAQLAWEIYSPAGELVKAENHYLHVPPDQLREASVAVHGLTNEFLAARGTAPAPVLARLADDLRQYRPRVVGHFMRFDFHVLGAGFWRAGLPNPLPGLPTFCTMLVTPAPPPGPPTCHRMRLGELHEYLFGQPMLRQHDAEIDAAATARCFFELRRRGDIPPAVLTGQPVLAEPVARPPRRWLPWLLAAAALAVLALLWWASRPAAPDRTALRTSALFLCEPLRETPPTAARFTVQAKAPMPSYLHTLIPLWTDWLF